MTPESPAPPSADPIPFPPIKAEVERLLGPEAVFEMAGKLAAFRLAPGAIPAACEKLKAAGFDYLLLVTAVDYPVEKRFELVYVITTFTDGREFCLVADVPRDDPHIETVSSVWETANWHEREVFDLFGIRFDKHPDLRRILLEDQWDGHPLRKDYEDKVHNVIKRPY